MRFYNRQHRHCRRTDLAVRTMDVWHPVRGRPSAGPSQCAVDARGVPELQLPMERGVVFQRSANAEWVG